MYTHYAIIAVAAPVACALVYANVRELVYQRIVTYRKVGGLHFVTIGRVGFNFYMRRAA